MTETKFCFQEKDRQYFRVNFIKLIADHCLTVLMLTVESEIISTSAPTDGLERGLPCCVAAASRAALPSWGWTKSVEETSSRNSLFLRQSQKLTGKSPGVAQEWRSQGRSMVVASVWP